MFVNAVVSIDGVDKTGKDTVRDLLVKKTEGKVLVYVRSFISQIAYGRLYSRNIDERFFMNEMLADDRRGRKFVVLTASKDMIARRCALTYETDLTTDDIQRHIDCFKSVVSESIRAGVDVITIDTSHSSALDTVDELIKRLNLGQA
jgi:thymidylate kinase